MDVSDIMKLLSGNGQGGGFPSLPGLPSPQEPPFGAAPQSVGDFMGAPAPQADASPPAPITAPITPPTDAGQGGLSGFLSHMVQKATHTDPATGMSFADRLGRFGGQITDMTGDTRGAAAGYQAHGDANLAASKRAKLQQMADSLGMSPREKLIFTADPEKWTAANAKNLEAATVPGGDTRVTPGAPPYSAPKYGEEKGEGYSATPTGITDTGSLAQSPAQLAEAAMKDAQEKSMALYHDLMAKAAARNADAHMASATRPRVGATAGGGLPPGYVPR